MTYQRGVLLVLSAGAFWSFIGLSVRLIETAGPVSVVFWRSLGMVPVILLLLGLQPRGGLIARLLSVGWPGLVAGLGITMAYFGAIHALQSTTVANAVFLYSTAPFFAAILGWLVLGERVSGPTVLAMLLAAAGLIVMLGEDLGTAGKASGNIAALLSALGFAIFTIALRAGRVADMMPANLVGALLSMAAAALLAPLAGQTIAAPWPDIAVALAMGAVILGGGMVCYTFGSRRLSAAECTLFSGIENILAPFWVWLLLGEAASNRTLTGGAMVLAAVVLNAFLGQRR